MHGYCFEKCWVVDSLLFDFCASPIPLDLGMGDSGLGLTIGHIEKNMVFLWSLNINVSVIVKQGAGG